MKRLLNSVKWDINSQFKYGIYVAATVVSIVWIAILYFIPEQYMSIAIPIILFTDLTTAGFFFIAALILFEKGQGSIDAVVVTPLRKDEYILSKVLSLIFLSIYTVVFVILITAFIKDFYLNIPLLIIAVILSASFYIIVGFIGVSPFNNLSNYLISSGLYLTVLSLPILDFVGVTSNHWTHYLMYLIPTQSALTLLKASFASVSNAEVFFSTIYLCIWIVALFKLSLYCFDKYIVKSQGGA